MQKYPSLLRLAGISACELVNSFRDHQRKEAFNHLIWELWDYERLKKLKGNVLGLASDVSQQQLHSEHFTYKDYSVFVLINAKKVHVIFNYILSSSSKFSSKYFVFTRKGNRCFDSCNKILRFWPLFAHRSLSNAGFLKLFVTRYKQTKSLLLYLR